MAAAKRTKEKRASAKRGRKPTRPRDAAKAPPARQKTTRGTSPQPQPKAKPVPPARVKTGGGDYRGGGASSRNKDGKGKNRGGRPTDYRPEMDDLAYHLALLGADDKKLGEVFGVDERTINNWKHDQPTFFQSLTRGKDRADAEIAQSLYHRAKGYSHPAVRIIAVSEGQGQGSRIEQVPYTQHYPPDTPAAALWLTNRQRRIWRNRQDHEISGPAGGPVALLNQPGPPEPETLEEWQAMADAMLAVRARQGRSRGERPK